VSDKEGIMLAGKEMVGTIAVKDLATARKFYEGTLGLKVEDDKGTEAHSYRSGATRLIVYRSQFAGTNKATALNFMVGAEIDNLTRALRERGVSFEHYDMPGTTWEGDVMVAGSLKAAWFKDPDGNILCLMNGG
jgi:catechol 2,3-dioxygenase-like lactoylglutathione lyase family enzyme